ncbi:MAG: filamentous hemagglutinin N-terminal domain-containing protein [Cyanobacteria bacterium P01_H01_bin.35]
MKSNSFLSVIFLTFFLCNFFTYANEKNYANAQIVPDQTLGQESSVIKSIDELKNQIEGGAIRGSNLFHSFQEFNVGEGRSVYFINPNGVENILTRITGNNPSNILGRLGVDGGANLFLVNPQGIFFGPNASLDIRGSFIATTVDEIRLGENGLFSATAPQTSSLLSVAPSALFSNQLETEVRGTITNQSIQQEVGLELPEGQTLALLGGDVVIDGGLMTVPEGRIELGSIGNNSIVRLNSRNKGYEFDYSDVTNFQDINISFAFINTQGQEGGGDISIRARSIAITEGSAITGSTNGRQPGGNIEIIASEIVEIVNSQVFSDVNPGATGNGGNINIQTQGLIFRDFSVIATETFGEGNAGNLTVKATEIEAIGNQVDEEGRIFKNLISSGVQQQGIGEGGTLNIETQQLSLQDGSQIGSSTFGEGKAGNLVVKAEEIKLIGISEDGFNSGLFATVQDGASGEGGSLAIETKRLSIQDGGFVGVLTRGAGNAGELNIKAKEIELIGIGRFSDLFSPSNISASVIRPFEGRASGNGGNILIETDTLTIQDGATINAITQGDGLAGQISIQSNDNITISGFSSIFGNSSAITATTELGATGNGGNIQITTPILNIDNGAVITARSTSDFDGGNITLNVKTLNLTRGGQVLTSSSSSGNGGTIEVNASDQVFISGIDSNFNDRQEIVGGELDTDSPESAIASRARDNSDAGSVTLNSPLLKVEDQGIVTVSSSGEGVAGSLGVNAPSIELNNGTLSAETNSGDEGNITINSSNISLENNSQITTSATGDATGGNITINTKFIVARDNSEITANAVEGQGGNITISAEGVFFDNSSQITASSALGIDGTVEINTQVDPTQGVVALSPELIDAGSIVAQNLCLPNQDGIASSSFVITGKGGLPPNPNQQLTVLRGVVDWETEDRKIISGGKKPTVVVYQRQETKNLPEISQATGWVMTEDSNITLTSTSYTLKPGSLQLIHPGCYLFLGSRE